MKKLKTDGVDKVNWPDLCCSKCYGERKCVDCMLSCTRKYCTRKCEEECNEQRTDLNFVCMSMEICDRLRQKKGQGVEGIWLKVHLCRHYCVN